MAGPPAGRVVTPEVRAAYDRAVAVATAVRQVDAPLALSILEDLDRDELVHVALGLGALVRQVFAEYCAGDRSDPDLVWSAWLLACQQHWDAAP